jgi:hypothetical protein
VTNRTLRAVCEDDRSINTKAAVVDTSASISITVIFFLLFFLLLFFFLLFFGRWRSRRLRRRGR